MAWWLAVAGVVSLLIAGVLWLLGNDAADDPAPKNATPTLKATPSASSTPTNQPPASSVPKPSTTPRQPTLPEIEPASPRRLVIGSAVDAGFDRAISSADLPLSAASSAELSRLASRGTPGSPGADTVVIVGEDRFDRSAALNDIADVAEGDTIELETYNATLTYTIGTVAKVDSEALAQQPAYSEKKPGRLLLIATTYDDQGNRTGEDTLVVAQLSAAVAS